jgi:hypothetical protein
MIAAAGCAAVALALIGHPGRPAVVSDPQPAGQEEHRKEQANA